MYFYFFALSTRWAPCKRSRRRRQSNFIGINAARDNTRHPEKARRRSSQSCSDLRCFALPKVLRGRDRYQKTRMEKVEYECDLENPERMSRDLQKWEKPSKIEKSAVFRP